MKIYVAILWFLVQINIYAETDNLKKHLSELKTLTAHFKQEVYEGHRKIQSSAGTVQLLRPGQFRWQTQTPMPQLIVSDGKTLWIYDEDLEQVSIKKLNNEMAGTPALFLSGYDETLSKTFSISETVKKQQTRYKLIPKAGANSQYRWLTLVYRNNTLSALSFEDNLGQITKVYLSQVKLNHKLKPALFNFVPPKGVDVVTH